MEDHNIEAEKQRYAETLKERKDQLSYLDDFSLNSGALPPLELFINDDVKLAKYKTAPLRPLSFILNNLTNKIHDHCFAVLPFYNRKHRNIIYYIDKQNILHALNEKSHRVIADRTITYSFMNAQPAAYEALKEADQIISFKGLVCKQTKIIIREQLSFIAKHTKLQFKEVVDQPGVGIRFGRLLSVSNDKTTRAITFFPRDDGFESRIFLNIDFLQNSLAAVSGNQQKTKQIRKWQEIANRSVISHEILHGLGFPHIGVYWKALPALLFQYKQDVKARTTLSYNGVHNSFGPDDIAFLELFFGRNHAYPGDTNFIFKAKSEDSRLKIKTSQQNVIIEGPYVGTLQDSDGRNTYDFSHIQSGVKVQMIPGGYSYYESYVNTFVWNEAGSAQYCTLTADEKAPNLYNGWRHRVHNCIGTAYDDMILGNDLNNIISPGDGVDYCDGDKGIDTLNLMRSNGSKNILNFERLIIADRHSKDLYYGLSGNTLFFNFGTLYVRVSDWGKGKAISVKLKDKTISVRHKYGENSNLFVFHHK